MALVITVCRLCRYRRKVRYEELPLECPRCRPDRKHKVFLEVSARGGDATCVLRMLRTRTCKRGGSTAS